MAKIPILGKLTHVYIVQSTEKNLIVYIHAIITGQSPKCDESTLIGLLVHDAAGRCELKDPTVVDNGVFGDHSPQSLQLLRLTGVLVVIYASGEVQPPI